MERPDVTHAWPGGGVGISPMLKKKFYGLFHYIDITVG
jgi:hypothetical protein